MELHTGLFKSKRSFSFFKILIIEYSLLLFKILFLTSEWGVDWGEEGYILLARNANNMCGVAVSKQFLFYII